MPETDNERILTAKNKRLEEENKEAWATINKLLEQNNEQALKLKNTITELYTSNYNLRDELEKRDTAEILYLKETITKETKKEVANLIFDAVLDCLKANKKKLDDGDYVSCDAIKQIVRNVENIMFGEWYH